MRLALKFAYDGAAFHGSQRQPGRRTVEGEILRAMGDLEIIASPRASRFACASRTDAGVNALGNVLTVETDFRLPGLLRALNSKLSDVWFWAFAEVGPAFNPRHATKRWYRYYLPRGPVSHPDRFREAAALLEGRHDFRAFTRAREGTARDLHSVTISLRGGWIVLDFRAQAFLWNMVRRLVAALEAVGKGTSVVRDIQRALEGGPGGFGLAPPWGLVLMDVVYDFPFRTVVSRASLKQLNRLWEQHHSRATFHEELLGRLGARPLEATEGRWPADGWPPTR